MGISPETKLIQKIHRQTDKYRKVIPATDGTPEISVPIIFKQKMNMMPGGISGIADYYYEANPNMLWVEYKAIPKWEGKRTIPINKVTDNQMNWLERAVNNGRHCAVIIGDEKGQCLILDDKVIFNTNKIKMENINLKTPKEVAIWIAKMTMGIKYIKPIK